MRRSRYLHLVCAIQTPEDYSGVGSLVHRHFANDQS